MIAYALEIAPQILPFAPELLADLDELGSNADLIVEALQTLHLPKTTRVIDLGCGKGALTFAIAKHFGWQVLGVDLFTPFIAGCREQADAEGLSHLCQFMCGDILKLADEIEPYDVAIFAALGDVLGSFEETIGVIRKYVRPGGYIAIHDDYLKDSGSNDFAGFGNYATHDEMVRRLTSHGDVLIQEFLETPEPPDAEDIESELIFQRAQTLAEQHPELKDALMKYVADQRSEVKFLRQNFVSTIWLLQRA